MFNVLVADPPWPFGDKLHTDYERGAAHHYKTCSMEEIRNFIYEHIISNEYSAEAIERFPIDANLSPNCVLFLWRVASMQVEALETIRSWGFTPKTEVVWLKKTVNGNRHFGMGHITRAEHETCLIATRGKPQVQSRSERSTFSGKVGRHSEKPEEFYQLVETLYDGPYLELFARKKRPGWTCLGDEL